MEAYDPRYLAGILRFNEADFFESHELWEDLWSESHGDTRRFYQGLIQAAVALYHFGNGNRGGALKLYRSAHDYMRPCLPRFLGLDVEALWRQMEVCFRPLFDAPTPGPVPKRRDEDMPVLTLDPPPEEWPDPADYSEEDE
jgi:hypothetical protein